MGYAVDALDPAADRAAFPEADRVLPDAPAAEARRPGSRLFAVVATMGQRDEEALLSALSVSPDYLAVVASRKRFAILREAALARGAEAGALERVKSPAGLDIGAKTPEEIALSILADIVEGQARLATGRRAAAPAAESSLDETAIDPVCGMTVTVAGARHRADHQGSTFFFCRAGCREKFLADPGRYGAVEAGALP
jgi:xanthine dehydrogenase accessory factor